MVVACLALLLAGLGLVRSAGELARAERRLAELERQNAELKRGLAKAENVLLGLLERERRTRHEPALPIAGLAAAVVGGNRAALVSSLMVLGSRLFAAYWKKGKSKLPSKTDSEEQNG